jgi:glycerophosphoryl diester phosphodiesterase
MKPRKQPDGKWVNYSYDWMFKPGAMKQIAQYADGIGPDYHMLVAEGSTPGHVKLTAMVKEAHASICRCIRTPCAQISCRMPRT